MLNKILICSAFVAALNMNLSAQEIINVSIIQNVAGKDLYTEPNENSAKVMHVKGNEIILCISNPSIEDRKNSIFHWKPVYMGDKFGYMYLAKKDLTLAKDNEYYMNLAAQPIKEACKKIAYTQLSKNGQKNVSFYADEKATEVIESLIENKPVVILDVEQFEKAQANKNTDLIQVKIANQIGYIYANDLVYAMLKNQDKGLCAQCLEEIKK